MNLTWHNLNHVYNLQVFKYLPVDLLENLICSDNVKMCFLFIMFFFRWKIVIWRVFCGGYWGKSKGRKNEKIFLLEILRTLRATPDLLDPQHFGFWIRDPDPDPRCKISTQTCKRNNLLPAPKSELLNFERLWKCSVMAGINIIKRRKIFWKFFFCLKKTSKF